MESQMPNRKPIRDPKTKIEKKVFCIIGDERAYRSKSPGLFSAMMERYGVDAVYVPFMVAPENIEAAVNSLKVLNIVGANVTIPYKEKVLPYLDVLSEGATIIGSINTIARDGESLKGYNTNAIGFMDTLKEKEFDAENKTAVVVGSGGAARAVVFILNWLKAKSIIITDPDETKTQDISNNIGGESHPLDDMVSGNKVPANIVVNATPASNADEFPGLKELVNQVNLQDCELLIDLNVGRAHSVWKEVAEKKGIPFIDGMLPLAHQAKRTFALWTGIKADPTEFIDVLKQ
jgi:shikimate dehydrogenase